MCTSIALSSSDPCFAETTSSVLLSPSLCASRACICTSAQESGDSEAAIVNVSIVDGGDGGACASPLVGSAPACLLTSELPALATVDGDAAGVFASSLVDLSAAELGDSDAAIVNVSIVDGGDGGACTPSLVGCAPAFPLTSELPALATVDGGATGVSASSLVDPATVSVSSSALPALDTIDGGTTGACASSLIDSASAYLSFPELTFQPSLPSNL
mmetsp:Transcript_38388/g.115008  ORF Transcript_38388/g.115008 Transcript_38388/m.115008 type:complete len:216 (+) Transcript_38388:341-988(+)